MMAKWWESHRTSICFIFLRLIIYNKLLPPNFIWNALTSAYRVISSWDLYATPSRLQSLEVVTYSLKSPQPRSKLTKISGLITEAEKFYNISLLHSPQDTSLTAHNGRLSNLNLNLKKIHSG